MFSHLKKLSEEAKMSNFSRACLTGGLLSALLAGVTLACAAAGDPKSGAAEFRTCLPCPFDDNLLPYGIRNSKFIIKLVEKI